jgi:hypothetical protein
MPTIQDYTAQRIQEDLDAGCQRMTPGQYRAACETLGYRLVTNGGMATGRYINTGNEYPWRAHGVTYIDIATGKHWADNDAPRDRIADMQALRFGTVVTSQGWYWEL